MELLITGAWKGAKDHFDALRQMGHTIHFMQYETDPLPCEAERIEGVVCNGLFLTHSMEQFKKLKLIQLTSAGYDRVPMEYVREKGIRIYNAGNTYSVPMAEFVLAGVLALYKRLRVFSRQQEQHLWKKWSDLQELAGKTVCIVGCGNIGTECAKRFFAFGCRVIGVNRSEKSSAYFERIVSFERLDEVLGVSDIVVLAVPAEKNTIHLIDHRRLERMKPSALLVNVGRGGLVDTRALTAVLSENRLAGAVLDVFEEEPLSKDSPLWDFENVIVSPHNSFQGEQINERLWKIVRTNMSGECELL